MQKFKYRNPPVGGRPIYGIGHLHVLGMIRTLQVVEHGDLLGIVGPPDARGDVVVLVEDHVGRAGQIAIGSQFAGVHGTLGFQEDVAALLHVPRTQSIVEEDGLQLAAGLDLLVVMRHVHQLVNDPIGIGILMGQQTRGMALPGLAIAVGPGWLWVVLPVLEEPGLLHRRLLLPIRLRLLLLQNRLFRLLDEIIRHFGEHSGWNWRRRGTGGYWMLLVHGLQLVQMLMVLLLCGYL